MKKALLFAGILITVCACGPSTEEIQEREQAIQDSIQVETQKQKELAEQQRIHSEKIEVGKSIKRTKLNNHLEEIESKLTQEKRRLGKINEFQLGRSSSTKNQQLREQHRVISQLEKFKEGLEYAISHTYLHQSYDFQNTPEGTVGHLISAAANEEYSKLRDIIDPYGEFDGDAFSICLVEMYPPEMKEQWKNEFAKARIMGTKKVNAEIAEVEIAMGIFSDKLETLQLIKRQDKWYIQSF